MSIMTFVLNLNFFFPSRSLICDCENRWIVCSSNINSQHNPQLSLAWCDTVGRCKAAKCPQLTFRVTKSRPECLWRILDNLCDKVIL